MKVLSLLVLVFGVALALAQTPSPFPSVGPTPSAFWGLPYWSSNYGDVVLGEHPANITNTASAALYYPLNDLPTAAMRAYEVVLGSHGYYLGMSNFGIVQNQQDQWAISGTAIHLVAATSSLQLSFISPSSSQSTAIEFWFLPSSGAQAVLFSASFSIELTDSLVTVKDMNGGTIFHSRPGAITVGKYAYVVVGFGPVASGNRLVKLYVDGVQMSQGIVADADFSFGLSSNVIAVGSGVYLDEYAQYISSTSADALTDGDIRLRFVVGELRACRCNPCFSASQCTPHGAESYQCGPCPPNYVGDGEVCVPNGPHDPLCHLPPSEIHNPYFCSENCDTLSECMECGMNFEDMDHIRARLACLNTTYPDPCTSGPCSAGYQCVVVGTNYRCDDIDECTLDTHDCQANYTCENTVGSFDCLAPAPMPCVETPCPSGFTCVPLGVTRRCDDIDECNLVVPPTCPPGTYCNNLNGTYECADINECHDGNNGGCADLCTNYYGYYVCTCLLPGYISLADGAICQFPADNFGLTLLRSTRIEQGRPAIDFTYTGLVMGYKNRTAPAGPCLPNECTIGVLLQYDLEALRPTSPAYNFSFNFRQSNLRYLVVGGSGNVAKIVGREILSTWNYKTGVNDSVARITWNSRPTSTSQIFKIPFYFAGNGTVTQQVPELDAFHNDRLNGVKTNFGLYLTSEANATYSEGTFDYAQLGATETHGAGADPRIYVWYTVYAVRKSDQWIDDDRSGLSGTTTSSV